MKVTIMQGDNLELLKGLPDCSVDSIVTDPPYGLGAEPDAMEVLRDWLDHGFHEIKGRGFAGKEWDAFVPQPLLWRECFRALKPGGHLVSFFGSRTYDWGVMALRLAGFEIRDQLAWIYGSGFPKSLDVGRAIDQADEPGKQRQRQLQFTDWVRSTGLTAKQINDATGTNMGGHYLTDKEQPAIATREHLDKLRPLISSEIPAWVEQMADERTAGHHNLKARKPVNVRIKNATIMKAIGEEGKAGWYTETEAHSNQAKAWEGWGTALKPAHEPIVLARKPFKGTVGDNVLEHRTGALNVDGCRVNYSGAEDKEAARVPQPSLNSETGNTYGYKMGTGRNGETLEPNQAGRWPANVIHDGSEEVLEGFPGELGGSAARFFYHAKATKKDRDEGLQFMKLRTLAQSGGAQGAVNNGEDYKAAQGIGLNTIKHRRNNHPTVKPTGVMAWLCRLVTPPGGTVLDPFAGSGSTGKAAILEGFSVILMEREAEYLPLIQARTSYAQDIYDRAHKSRQFSALQLALKLDEEDAA